MIKLTEYIKKNRIEKPVELIPSWYGEMVCGTSPCFYNVPVNNGEKKVFCFISYPTTPMPKNGYPAILLIHGGNGQAFYEMSRLWADRGFITITPDFNGCFAKNVNERQLVNNDGGNPGYGSINDLNDDHPWAYFSVLSAMRAVDVLFSLDTVDKNNIFSCGLSWGGVIQLLLSSVENRTKACGVIYSSAYIYDSDWGKNVLKSLSEKDLACWKENIDPKNYLSSIKTPMFFTAGTDDIAFKMECRRLTANDIKAPKYFALRKNFPHGNFYGFEQLETVEFFNCMIKNKPIPQPIVNITENILTVKPFDKKSELYLCYTKDDLDTTDKQNWELIQIKKGKPFKILEGTTAIFANEKLKTGTVWSSNMIRF